MEMINKELITNVVIRVIQQHDPLGLLAGGASDNEYSSEADQIVLRIVLCRTPLDVATLIARVFKNCFSIEYQPEQFQTEAEEIFNLLQKHNLIDLSLNRDHHLDELLQEAEEAYQQGDYKEAFKLFEAAAWEGVPDAMLTLGAIYSSGEGVVIDYDRAAYWEQRAVEAGFEGAIYNLAITCRMMGELRKSRLWFEKSLETGNIDAAIELAKLYMVSDRELKTAKKYLEQALQHAEELDKDQKQEVKTLLKEIKQLRNAYFDNLKKQKKADQKDEKSS